MLANGLRYLVLLLAALVILFPVLYALAVSLESAAESVAYPPVFIPTQLHWESYQKALETAPILRFITNSFIVSAVVTVGQIITASLAAYAFSFLDFPGRSYIFYAFLSTMMIPWEVTIIPNYFTIKELGWLDTYQGLSVPFLASAFGTFMLRQSFLTLPKQLFEAARIDGCGHFRFFLTMVLPLSRPALGTLAVYAFLMTYNQYLWPLLVTNSDVMRTVQIGLSMLQWDQAAAWNSMMAGVILVSIPTALLLVLGQKQLVRGLTKGAIKG
ncbi:glycerol-3-phosphate ABC transporter permease [Anaerosporomusa subterranea]|uniref:Glycerol-3-phosphate ABC transporter permease n=1 Tax=Anaerosporomusa subterranea TaxID=1794912 RepID=A0A154BP44_ANASB|nr:glycerol-3-phosphate ABC transporter permease [Anaerosporomusa subterranea]